MRRLEEVRGEDIGLPSPAGNEIFFENGFSF